MWTRAELKKSAKTVLKRSYWESLAAYVITFVIISAASGMVAIIPVINVFGAIAVNLFLSFPIMVGLYSFFIQARMSPPGIKNLFYAFNETRYMKIVAAMAWQYLFIFLWSLLPAVGGAIFTVNIISNTFNGVYFNSLIFDTSTIVFIVLCGVIILAGSVIVMMKSIAYSMVAFILTDNPNINYARALKLSIQMTNGQKWNIFVLTLSFLGWILLSVVTFFIGLLFLMPYIMATYSELYVKLRENAIRTGLCTPQELTPPPAS